MTDNTFDAPKQIQFIKGRIWVLGEDVDTDIIYPGKYLPILDPVDMARHALEGIDVDFPKKIQQGDIIVAGKGFGCGSSREQAATCLKMAGIGAIVAGSFARIFFRNAINQGLPIVQANILPFVKTGDIIEIDFIRSEVKHVQIITSFPPLDPSVQAILNEGGLIAAVRKRFALS